MTLHFLRNSTYSLLISHMKPLFLNRPALDPYKLSTDIEYGLHEANMHLSRCTYDLTIQSGLGIVKKKNIYITDCVQSYYSPLTYNFLITEIKFFLTKWGIFLDFIQQFLQFRNGNFSKNKSKKNEGRKKLGKISDGVQSLFSSNL